MPLKQIKIKVASKYMYIFLSIIALEKKIVVYFEHTYFWKNVRVYH